MADAPRRCSPRRSAPRDDSGTYRARDAAEVLAEALNLRAAGMREALELARDRRLELDRVRKERDEALRDRDLWRQRLAGLRRRRSVRAALGPLRVVRSWRATLLHRLRRGGAEDGAPAAVEPGRARRGTVRRIEPTSPAAYRATILGRLESGHAGTGSLRVARIDDGDAAAAAADVVVVTRPTTDPRHLDRAAITVALVADDVPAWTSAPWFDSFDIVLVPDEDLSASVDRLSAKTAAVAPAGAEGWPAADAVQAAVHTWASATRIAVMVQALRWDRAEPSGDYHMARALQRQFERRGHPTSIYFQREWTDPPTAREDIVLHLWGRYELNARPTQVNAIWILYHPELVTDELCRRYDVVFAASETLAARLADRTGLAVRSLHQATDHERFQSVEGGPRHELLFVGNSRGTRRTIIDDVTPTSHDLAVYGGGWDPERLDPRYLRGAVVPNRELPAYYAAAGIVLNDHWVESMEAGLINNRIYDALAAGAFVISDPAPGLDAEFDGGVVTYRDPADLALTVERFLADPAARRPYVERGRRAVLGRHTMAHRADEILSVLLPLAGRATDSPAPAASLVDAG